MNKLDEALAILKYDASGLIPAIVVDAETKDVLMMAYMNADAVRKTVETGRTHFWSRSRGKPWVKGETSGHTQAVRAVYTDCDADTLIVEVIQKGAACHHGYRSCFYRRLAEGGGWDVIAEKVFDPKDVYKDR